jgi:arginine decarboxylase-like protein
MALMRASLIWIQLLAAGVNIAHGQVGGGMVVGYAGGGASQGLTNLPYTANRKITTVQKLANGATITRTTTAKEARDSQGRTMTESKPLVMGDFPPEVDFTHVTVMDPVAHTWLS